ncbi:hypothetical protein BDW74DRAFT_181801 [Aspergillus multicolor]|uniref:uncharacterized protein n=1 Tax=Aspergillus multicolor TaxID=41759 RepID=UPI003CCD63A5
MHLTLPFLAALVTTASAIQCLSPPAPNPLNLCKDWKVCWSSVNTDPTSMCIYLTNFGLSYPPTSIKVGGPVSTSAGCLTIPGKCRKPDIQNGPWRVRIAACNDSNTIYSECNQLTVTQPCCPATRRSRIEGQRRDYDYELIEREAEPEPEPEAHVEVDAAE